MRKQPAHKKPGNHRVRKIVLWSLSGTIVGLAVAAGGLYEYLKPSRHFQKKNIPTIASPQNNTREVKNPVKRYQAPKNGTFNLLILGIDARKPSQAARTDTILLIHVDLNKHTYEAISIPRDTRVDLPKYGETKITHANYMAELNGTVKNGAHATIQAVSNLTGLTINYYAETSFWGLKDIVNTIGGINLYLPFKDQIEVGGPIYAKGYHKVNGTQLLALTRERHTLPQGDFGRQRVQEEALIAIAKKLLQPSEVSKIPTVISELKQYLITTNLTNQDFMSLAMSAEGFKASEVHYYQVPGHSAYEMDPIVKQKLYYWIADQKKLNQIIQAHFE